MYAGLTTADKGALIKLKESGVKITTIISLRQSANTRLKSNYDNIDIDLALAQIAEMESKQNNALSEKASEKGCVTWNERINQMTVEEKAKWLYDMDVCRVSSISIEECNSYGHCMDCMKNMLNSPYTEGANK